MTTLLERGLSMAARVLPAAAGGEIVYQRGEDRVWLDATWGRTEFQVDTADGVQIEYSDRDFIVAAADLVLSAKSSNSSLLPIPNMVFSGSGSDRFLTLIPTEFAVGND